MQCEFFLPERIIFGEGVSQKVGDCVKDLKGDKAFIVTDEVVAGLDTFKDIQKSLNKQGVDYYIYTEVDPDPTDIQVEKGAKLYKKESADVLVAIGGGSAIDSAKDIGILVNNGGSIRDYDGADRFKNQTPPLTIPTTAGTGSEVTMWSVITNTKDNYKMAPGGWKLLPKIALVDPLMTASMPPLMDYNIIAVMDRLVEIAVAMGEQIEGLSKREAAVKAPLAVSHLAKSIGLKTKLSEYGLDPKVIPGLAKWALKDGDLPGNPRVLDLEEIKMLYQRAF